MALLSLSQEAENQFLTQSGQETVAISSSVGRGNLSPEETADWIKPDIGGCIYGN